jgi:hypothetical protein
MTGILKAYFRTVAKTDLLIIVAGNQQRKNLFGIRYGIKRLSRVFAGTPILAITVPGFGFLYERAIPQHNLQQLASRLRSINCTLKPLLDKQRKPARMVNMRMSYDNSIDFSRMKRKSLPKLALTTLLQPALNQNLLPINLNAETTTGNLPRRTIEHKPHCVYPPKLAILLKR